MNPDDLKQAWQAQSSQTRLTIDADLLLQEVRRNQQQFDAMIFWRDVREVGLALLFVPVWFYMGMRLSLPWAWYLAIPAFLWIAGFMLLDRMRHRRRCAEVSDSLWQRVASSLAEVNHQIWLLRNVTWWYLLPLALALLALFGQMTWEVRAGGWWTVLSVILVIIVNVIGFVAIHRLNQHAVRDSLAPRRHELETLLASLQDESSAPS